MKKISKKKYILLTLFLALVVARIVAPGIILKNINSYLADFSENYYAHIDGFGLGVWRGAYRFENVTLAFKNHLKEPFLTVEGIDVSVAWREIFKGRILTDIVTEKLNFKISQFFNENIKKDSRRSADEARNAGQTLFPIQAERIQLHNSYLSHQALGLFISDIEGTLSNATPTDNNPLSLVTLKGTFLGKSFIKIVSTLNQKISPTSWVIAAELQKLNVVDLNTFINRYVPLTFKQGRVDAYAEVKSEGQRISGYLKPFLRDATVIGDDKDFKGLKHFGTELSVSFLNVFFRSSKDHTVATKILFTLDDKDGFKWNVNEALGQLFANGYQHELNPGIENILKLSDKNSDSSVKDTP